MFVPPIDYYPFRYSSAVKPGSVLDIKFWSASDFTSAWFRTSLSTSLESSGKEIISQNKSQREEGLMMSEDDVKMTDIVEIDGKLDRLCDNLDVMRQCQFRMTEDISKIKEAVYNPDQGLYARLRAIEQWKEQTSKVVWVIMTSVIGLVCATIWQTFFN